MGIAKKPHIMENFVVSHPYQATKEREFGVKAFKIDPESYLATALYYILHTGREVETFIGTDGHYLYPAGGAGKECGGASSSACVDARIPSPKGEVKVFGGLVLPHEMGDGERIAVMGHTDCGFMKLSLAVNVAAAHLKKRGEATFLSNLVALADPALEEVVKPLQELYTVMAERRMLGKLHLFLNEMVKRGTVRVEKGQILPVLPEAVEGLLSSSYDVILLVYTAEMVMAHATMLSEKGIRAAPYIYVTENGRIWDLLSGHVYQNREVVGKREGVVGTLHPKELPRVGDLSETALYN